MKKKLFFMFLGVFLLCGCEMKGEYEFTINEDKSMNLEVIMGFDDELIDVMMSINEGDNEDIFGSNGTEDETTDLPEFENETTEYTDEERREYLKTDNLTISGYTIEEIKQKGLVVEEFQDEKYTGYKITGKVDNIDNLIGTADFNLDDIADINNKKIFIKDGSIYNGKIIVGDPIDSGEDTTSTSGINLIYNFTLNLPNKAKSSNATKVSEDGKTLTWDLSTGNISTIEFAFEFPSIMTFLKDNMILTAGIAVVVVLLIVVIITLLLKKSSKKNEITTNNVTNIPTNEQTMINTNTLDITAPTQINQNINQTIQPQLEQNQTMINQLNKQIVQHETNINNQNVNQSVNIQPSVVANMDVNLQTAIQQPVQNVSQEEIINAMNSGRVIPKNQSQTTNVSVQPQPEINTGQQINNYNLSNNVIPEIKPIQPSRINVQPSQQTGVTFANGETQVNNNINN